MFASPSPEDLVQIVITERISVVSFDEYRVNWQGYKEQHFIPYGKHTIHLLPVGYHDESSMGSITYNFSPGHRYVLSIGEETLNTTTSGNVTTTRKTARPQIDEYGVTEYVVPEKNQSIVEFSLLGGIARVNVGNKSYTLYASSGNEGDMTLRLILPNGTHQASVRSWEFSDLYNKKGITDTVSFNLQNQFVSYNVTGSYLFEKQKETPLQFIGKWKFDLFNGKAVMYCSFRTDNTGYSRLYEDDEETDTNGNFKYSFTDKVLTIQESTAFSMEYTLNENELTLKNFWGLPETVKGIRQ